ncbi:MAG: 50S ribosomal protein L17 [Chloroflexi bacterium]|nr:50S ribosomal protein L17 [Chloroflexota bacterium]
MRGDAERLITLARNSSNASEIEKVNARRLAAARLSDAEIVKKLFDDIGPRFADRKGGYTRMLKVGPRLGDAAEMVLLELVEE